MSGVRKKIAVLRFFFAGTDQSDRSKQPHRFKKRSLGCRNGILPSFDTEFYAGSCRLDVGGNRWCVDAKRGHHEDYFVVLFLFSRTVDPLGTGRFHRPVFHWRHTVRCKKKTLITRQSRFSPAAATLASSSSRFLLLQSPMAFGNVATDEPSLFHEIGTSQNGVSMAPLWRNVEKSTSVSFWLGLGYSYNETLGRKSVTVKEEGKLRSSSLMNRWAPVKKKKKEREIVRKNPVRSGETRYKRAILNFTWTTIVPPGNLGEEGH